MFKVYSWSKAISVTLLMAGVACHASSSDGDISSATSQELRLPQSLTMLTTPNYCPYEMIGKDGDPLGFDIALAEALIKELGRENEKERSLQIQTTPHFNSIMPQLVQWEADFAMAAITPTAAREKIVAFSEIYYVQKIAIVSRQNQPLTTLDALLDKRVGITINSAHIDRLSQYPNIQLVAQFNSTNEVIEAIKRQYVDAGILDAAIAPKYVAPSSRLQVHLIEPLSDTAGVAIAFPPGSPLISHFNQALSTLHEQGKIQQLIYEWFDNYQCPESEE